MKKLLSVAIFSCTAFVGFAQQDPQFSQNMFNRLSINPGYAGTRNAICATAMFRQQWVSFPGAPKTGLIGIDYGQILHGGVGLTIMSDQLGFDKSLFAKAAYSYHLPLGPGTLGIGMDVGMIQKSIQGAWITPSGSNGADDPVIPMSGVSKTTYDLGLGAYYSTNKLFFGLSSSHLPQQTISAGTFKYEVTRHYYVIAGYDYQVTSSIDLMPSVHIKSDARSTQLDINVLAQWNKFLWGGVSYRMTDAIVALIGINKALPSGSIIRFGYSYDVTTSSLKNHSSGSHEIMLGYCFKVTPPDKKQSHQNVRFL